MRTLLQTLAQGDTAKVHHFNPDGLGKDNDRHAVEAATGLTFAAFEKAWLVHVKKQPFPKVSLPASEEIVTLKESSKTPAKDGREINFWDFTEVHEPAARRAAHLGELLRERSRMAAAAEEFSKAYREVGDRYPSVSNKYALSLLALRRLDEAERVLQGSLKVHPGSPTTQVHLGRIYLTRGDGVRAKEAFLEALASDPFDPEIHVSLTRVGELLADVPLHDRARKAGSILTGLSPEEVDRLARKLDGKERDLAEKNVPVLHESAAPAGERSGAAPPDAGMGGNTGAHAGGHGRVETNDPRSGMPSPALPRVKLKPPPTPLTPTP